MPRVLNADDVFEIRAAYAAGETQGSLARRYEMSGIQIGRIVRGESWAHVPGAVGVARGRGPAIQDRPPPTQEEIDASAAKLLALLNSPPSDLDT